MPSDSPEILSHSDGFQRCWWCGTDSLYVDYHDQEWGRPTFDDRRLFEKICLEGFQAGLSWITILRKREHFRDAFHDFELERVARMNQRTVDKLLTNAGIIRHRGKIESTINNAKRAIELAQLEGSLSNYFWRFRPTDSICRESKSDVPSKTEESKLLSKDLKKMGWTFVGPTTCYAFMQAMGLVNDHLADCDFWKISEQASRQP